MNIDIKDIITLNDNNRYVVVSKVNYQNNIYYYLITEDKTDVKFCIEKKGTPILSELVDQKFIQTLLPLFVDATKKVIDFPNE
jgi:hypothetical protein